MDARRGRHAYNPISGTGEMYNYSFDKKVPWYNERNSLKKVVINNGVTSIGDLEFSGCTSLTEIYYPAGADFAKKLRAGNNAELIPY